MTKLIFKHPYPLDSERRELFKTKKWKYPSWGFVRKKTKALEKLWERTNKEKKIMKRISEITKVKILSTLEVFVIGGGLRPMSQPFIVPIISFNGKVKSEDEFIELIIHETIHNFVGDIEGNPRLKKYWNYIYKKHENKSPVTINHIIVYAVMSVLLTEMFGKNKMIKLIGSLDKFPDYKKAWQIVQKEGDEKLIKEFHKYFGKNEKI